MLNRKSTSIVASLLISTACTQTIASEVSFDKATALFQNGFKQCVIANNHRSTNLALAKQSYKTYLTLKAEAIRIDDSILTTSERDMPSNLAYCEKVQVNLLKAEAEPIFNAGIDACQAAQRFLESDNTQSADAQIKVYEEKTTQAIAITDSILSNFAVASNYRHCERLKTSLMTLVQERELLDKETSLSITYLKEAHASCAAAQSAASAASVTNLNSSEVNKHINNVALKVGAANKLPLANSAIIKYPKRPSSIEILAIKSTIRSCQQRINATVAQAQQQHKSVVTKIKSATNSMQTSLKYCESGKHISTSPNQKLVKLDQSIELYNSALKMQAQSRTMEGALLAKQYSQLQESKRFTSVLNNASQCSSQLAALHTQHKKQKAHAQQQLAVREALKKKNEEKQRIQAEQTRAEQARVEKANIEQAAQIEQEKLEIARIKRSQSQFLNDTTSAVSAMPQKQSTTRSKSSAKIRKSWTDLVEQDAAKDLFDDDSESDTYQESALQSRDSENDKFIKNATSQR